MAFIVEEDTGNIILIQGDSGKYPVEDVPCDKHYTAYFGIYNNRRKPVGFEVTCDIPAYNAGQVVYDKDLFCFNYSGSDLYTANRSPEVGDVLYDVDNEETEYTVSGIKSITTVDGTFQRNSANDLKEYHTDLYAWGDTSLYTESLDVKVGDTLYDIEGTATANTVSAINSIITDHGEYTRDSEHDTGVYHTDLYAIEGIYNNNVTYYYVESENPEVGDVVYNSNSEQISAISSVKTIYKYVRYNDNEPTAPDVVYVYSNPPELNNLVDNEYGQNINNQYGSLMIDYVYEDGKIRVRIPKQGGAGVQIYTRADEYHKCFCFPTEGTQRWVWCYRSIQAQNEDIRTLVEVLYTWKQEDNYVYTLDEEPEVGDNTVDIDGQPDEAITGIGSFKVSTTVYDRNVDNDVRTLIGTLAYAWSNIENTIFTLVENPEIGNNTYDSNIQISGVISEIGSILVGVLEYIRNIDNDIKKTELPDPIPTTNIEFKIPASLTNHLKVNVNEETAEYYFGIKLCSDDEDEDTLLLGDSEIGDLNTITVYPKKLEGTING